MVFLNGQYLEKEKAFVSVMDRGFLFADGVYEVIPVYHQKIFRVVDHLKRLQNSLNALNIENPYSQLQWQDILNKLVLEKNISNQSLYIQITRGVDKTRQHKTQSKLIPTVFIESNPLIPFKFDFLKQGHSCLTKEDIRWHRCDIKSISLLANVLYAQTADKNIAETILVRQDIVTEGSSSNVFMIKKNVLWTHPENELILSGITRGVVLELAKQNNLSIKESPFSLMQLYDADEVLISSSTREIMPITKVDDNLINQGKVGEFWGKLYLSFQKLKK